MKHGIPISMEHIKHSSTIKDFTDLRAWKEGHALVIEIYAVVKSFPKEELFGLTSQMRRSVVSVTSNIAEGFSRTSGKNKIHFYVISQGSLTELQNQLIIAKDIDMLTKNDFDMVYRRTVDVHKIITGLIKATRTYTT
jgi:four helix bundle protein